MATPAPERPGDNRSKVVWHPGETGILVFECAFSGEMMDAINTADAVSKPGDAAKVFGNPDNWQLLSKFSKGDVNKSTKAMQIDGPFGSTGCLVQVTEEKSGSQATALAFVPGAIVVEDANGGRKLIVGTAN